MSTTRQTVLSRRAIATECRVQRQLHCRPRLPAAAGDDAFGLQGGAVAGEYSCHRVARRPAERRCGPHEMVGGVSGSASELAHRTGRHLEPDGCAGGSAVPGGSSGDSQCARGPVPHGDRRASATRARSSRRRRQRRPVAVAHWWTTAADRLLVRSRSLGTRPPNVESSVPRLRRRAPTEADSTAQQPGPSWRMDLLRACAASMRSIARPETTQDGFERALQLTRRGTSGRSSGWMSRRRRAARHHAWAGDRPPDRAGAVRALAIAILVGKAARGSDEFLGGRAIHRPLRSSGAAIPARRAARPDVAAAERRVAGANAQIGVAQRHSSRRGTDGERRSRELDAERLLTLPSRFWAKAVPRSPRPCSTAGVAGRSRSRAIAAYGGPWPCIARAR